MSLSHWKLAFGFLLLLVIGGLAAAIALGKVYQESSFGLDIILGGLINMAGGFGNWAFGESRSSRPHEDVH